MEENKEMIQEEEVKEPTNEQYIDAIKQIQANTVSKEKYNELLNENKKLLNSLVNGETIKVEEKKASQEDIINLRKKLRSEDLSNLDYIKTTLELRKALIDNGQPDPFLPKGQQITITANDIASANHCAEVYQECIDYADGDSQLFTQELQRRTNDVRVRR